MVSFVNEHRVGQMDIKSPEILFCTLNHAFTWSGQPCVPFPFCLLTECLGISSIPILNSESLPQDTFFFFFLIWSLLLKFSHLDSLPSACLESSVNYILFYVCKFVFHRLTFQLTQNYKVSKEDI